MTTVAEHVALIQSLWGPDEEIVASVWSREEIEEVLERKFTDNGWDRWTWKVVLVDADQLYEDIIVYNEVCAEVLEPVED